VHATTGITNPELGDCSVKALKDTCSLQIETIDSLGNTIDFGETTFDVAEEPSLTFTVTGVASGTSTNGVTTNLTTEYNEVNFGKTEMFTPKFGAHSLNVISNAPYGYQVKMHTDGYLEGLYPRNKIDPFQSFTDPPTTWDNPTVWSSPFGTCDDLGCSDAGWIGANTSDTRVGGGWTSGSGKFGPVSSNRHIVMQSSGRDTGTSAFVTYGLEVYENVRPDDYAVTLIYEVLATY
jgi:hypothetical protein